MSIRLSTRDVSKLLSDMGMNRNQVDPILHKLLSRNRDDYISFESFTLGVMTNLYERVVEREKENEASLRREAQERN